MFEATLTQITCRPHANVCRDITSSLPILEWTCRVNMSVEANSLNRVLRLSNIASICLGLRWQCHSECIGWW
jgi:hypothetical protein